MARAPAGEGEKIGRATRHKQCKSSFLLPKIQIRFQLINTLNNAIPPTSKLSVTLRLSPVTWETPLRSYSTLPSREAKDLFNSHSVRVFEFSKECFSLSYRATFSKAI